MRLAGLHARCRKQILLRIGSQSKDGAYENKQHVHGRAFLFAIRPNERNLVFPSGGDEKRRCPRNRNASAFRIQCHQASPDIEFDISNSQTAMAPREFVGNVYLVENAPNPLLLSIICRMDDQALTHSHAFGSNHDCVVDDNDASPACRGALVSRIDPRPSRSAFRIRALWIHRPRCPSAYCVRARFR